MTGAAAPSPRPFRFGLASGRAGSAAEWRETALRTEARGYSTLLLPDVPGQMLGPLTGAAMAAASTTTLRVGTYVLANDLRNPVLLASEAATIDLLSDGRFELGLGAGNVYLNDYSSLGLVAESGSVRVSRMAESARIIAALLRGERVSSDGPHYAIKEASLYPRPARRPSILIAAVGRRAVELAGQVADIVALGARGGAEMEAQVELLKNAAGERFAELELGATFFVYPESDEPARRFTAGVLRRLVGMEVEALVAAGLPTLLVGSPEAMAEQLQERRERLGLSYVVVFPGVAGAFQPVVERLAGC